MEVGNTITIKSKSKDFDIIDKQSDQMICTFVEKKTNQVFNGFITKMSTNGNITIKVISKG